MTERSGSDLCLQCGLCCNGVLHSRAILVPADLPLADELGLDVFNDAKGCAFRLPCPRFQDGKCSVYDRQRPHICGAYQCALLKKYLSDQIDLSRPRPLCTPRGRRSRRWLRKSGRRRRRSASGGRSKPGSTAPLDWTR